MQAAAARVAPSMNAGNISQILVSFASMGWQGGEGSDSLAMREKLGKTIIRVSTSMTAENVAHTVWALAVLRWQPVDWAMREAMQGAAARVSASMTAQQVAETLWALEALGWRQGAESLGRRGGCEAYHDTCQPEH
jgi:hypothetical protein